MRIVTGTARGRKLETPPGQHTRPTAERVKEAVFSTIHFEVPGALVLDLFAGSGQMGIEALSRGAKACVFVDNNKNSQTVIAKNLTNTGFAPEAKLVAMDAFSFLASTQEEFDLVFLDPPYQKELMEKLLVAVAPRVGAKGMVICETLKTEVMPESVGVLRLQKSYRYGQTKITTYRREEK